METLNRPYSTISVGEGIPPPPVGERSNPKKLNFENQLIDLRAVNKYQILYSYYDAYNEWWFAGVSGSVERHYFGPTLKLLYLPGTLLNNCILVILLLVIIKIVPQPTQVSGEWVII